MATQLIQPNLNVTGQIGWCLQYARQMFGRPPVEDSAWNAWLRATKHTDRNYPRDVAVPLWFSYFTGGVNKGHVVVAVPGKGLYSSPWQLGTTHAVLSSIEEVEQKYGAKYVGWSEDISGAKVIQIEEDKPMLNEDEFYMVFRGMLGRDPQPDEAKSLPRDANLLARTLWNNGSQARYEEDKNPKPGEPTVLSAGTYKVK